MKQIRDNNDDIEATDINYKYNFLYPQTKKVIITSAKETAFFKKALNKIRSTLVEAFNPLFVKYHFSRAFGKLPDKNHNEIQKD